MNGIYLNDAFRNVTDTVMAHFTVPTEENGGPRHSSSGRTHASYGRSGLASGVVLVGFVMDKVTVRQTSPPILRLPMLASLHQRSVFVIYFPGRRQRDY